MLFPLTIELALLLPGTSLLMLQLVGIAEKVGATAQLGRYCIGTLQGDAEPSAFDISCMLTARLNATVAVLTPLDSARCSCRFR